MKNVLSKRIIEKKWIVTIYIYFMLTPPTSKVSLFTEDNMAKKVFKLYSINII